MISANHQFKLNGQFIKRSLPLDRTMEYLELGLERAQASFKAGLSTTLGGGWQEHIIAAVSEGETFQWLGENYIEGEPVCFRPDFSTDTTPWDLEIGSHKVDVKCANGISPTGVIKNGHDFLVSAWQVNKGGPDIYLHCRVDRYLLHLFLIGWIWADEISKIGKMRKNLPRPAWSIPIPRLHSMKSLLGVLSRE